ncbi:MAG: alanine--tRNA ligase [Pseudomonadota bacterium]
MPTSSREIRQSFLDFFSRHQHQVVRSYPLVPANDPTLLFTNAGMVQFKDLFTGAEKRDYKRATSSQKCVRAGGKHNDLENVGRTARHHTFFEMLGNFSFGDYFKREAIRYAWDWVTKDLGMDPGRLVVTVFGGGDGLPADDEAAAIWRDDIGVPEARILRGDKKDNFWQMGDTGPCGPCSELHYDRGRIEGTFGGDDPEGDQRLEIWNLVFMQYEMLKGGQLKPLPAPSVDTGAGLERLAMVLGGHRSNYDTDLFAPLIERCAAAAGKVYGSTDSADDVSLRVIADHSRATAFLIADGVLPSNDGRGYVLRRILRRAIRHGARLGFQELFFHQACDAAIELMGPIYPELIEARSLIGKLALQEEETFRRTLDRGLRRFEVAVGEMKNGTAFDGAVVHKLYEQDGFPTDLTEVLCRERGLQIDWQTFDQAKQAHTEASRGALGLEGIPEVFKSLRSARGATPFLGYDSTEAEATVLDLVQNDATVTEAAAGERVALIVDRTPFYGESGGQLGDTGEALAPGLRLQIEDTRKYNDLIVHLATVREGTLRPGTRVTLQVDAERRDRIRANHTGTHLMHWALRTVLGDHVKQAGSLVAPDRLRFDFSHFQATTDEELARVEQLVNQEIQRNSEVQTRIASLDDAKASGAMALFGEKYAEQVRMVRSGPNSLELCGGTHVTRTGDIGLFKITDEGPLAAGVRRIEAVTHSGAVAAVQVLEHERRQLARLLKVGPSELVAQVEKMVARVRELERALADERSRAAAQQAGSLIDGVREVHGVRVLATRVEGVDAKALREYADKLRDKLGSGLVVLGAESGGKANLLVAVTQDLTGTLHAGKLVKQLAGIIGGSGGGRADFAQAGGNDPGKIDEALARALELI